ncbi:MAG: serine O-acetyltransferase EpsC [Pseudomonadota bacterium]
MVAKAVKDIVALDPVWEVLQREAREIIAADPAMGAFAHGAVLNQNSLEEAVAARIALRLDRAEVPADTIRRAFRDMWTDEPDWSEIVRVDIATVFDRDPACERVIEPILYFKGFHAIQTHRLANWAHRKGRRDFSLYLQSVSSEVFQTDINPACPFGRGIFIDHATGIVIGETSRIGDNVSLLQGVTLGGTGKNGEDRHPKVDDGVLVGANAVVLGNITIGHCSRVAAGSVVLKDVPANTTVAGVPAKVVGVAGCAEPSRTMNQILADQDATR